MRLNGFYWSLRIDILVWFVSFLVVIFDRLDSLSLREAFGTLTVFRSRARVAKGGWEDASVA